MAPVDDLRRDLTAINKEVHGVDVRLAVVETQLADHRKQSQAQHDDVMTAIRDLQRSITPPPPPSLPPGPALATMPPEHPEPPSDPGAITISPRRLAPWLRLILPYLVTAGLGGAAAKAVDVAVESVTSSTATEVP
jgi:hypothetical protein